MVKEKNNLFYQFDPANGGSLVQVGSGGPSNLYNPDYNNFAPRVAFAYDVTGKGRTVVRGGWGLFYDAFSQDIFLGHLPWNCIFCPGPAYPGIGSERIAIRRHHTGAHSIRMCRCTAASDRTAIFSRLIRKCGRPIPRISISMSSNKSVAKQYSRLGMRDRRAPSFSSSSISTSPVRQQITAADLANGVSGYGVPRPYSNFFYLNQERSSANSIYHSLQTSLHISSWHGLSTQANFVWSHAIDTASDLEDFTPNQAQPQNSTNPAGDRGNSSFDIRRRFTVNFNYEFPKMSGAFGRPEERLGHGRSGEPAGRPALAAQLRI